jgi:subtilase family serine protease
MLSAGVFLSSVVASSDVLVGLRHPAGAVVELEQTFWDVADPTHARYQQYLTVQEIGAIVRPTAATLAATKEWLTTLGATSFELTPTGDSLRATIATVSKAPHVPVALRAQHVDYAMLLAPVEHEADEATAPVPRAAAHAMDSTLGPAAQKKAYSVPAGLVATNATNLQMVWGTGTFGYRPDDLALFYRTYAPTGTDLKLVTLDVNNAWKGDVGKNFVEGMLDVSYITAMAPGVRTIVANTNATASTEAGEDFGTAMLSFLTMLSGRFELPHVLSLSLGSLSFGACDKVCSALAAKGGHTYPQCWDYLQTQFQACMFGDADVVTRIETELMKVGLRGTTVVAASGDGASHFAFGPFQGGIGDDLNTIICDSMHMPVYPTSSPFVLSVGGTEWSSDDMYGPTCSSTQPCGWDSGGGGFAWSVGTAPYQNATVPAYVSKANGVAPKVSVLLCTVTYYANLAHSLTRSP